MKRNRIGPRVLLPLALALWAGAPAVSRADNLDKALTGYATDVLQFLRQEKELLGFKGSERVAGVGVLPFRAVKGNRKPSFIAGPINTNLTTRLENALIMVNDRDEKKATGVVRDAGRAATAARVGSWFSQAAQRRKLFDVTYPLAWGGKKVKADVFLTGLVSNTGDRTRTEVRIQAFSRKAPEKLVEVCKFTVATDRSLLSDLGYNFSLPKKSLVVSRGLKARGKQAVSKERDRLAVSLVRRRDEGQLPPAGEGGATADDVGGMALKVLYNGTEREIKPLSQSGGQSKDYYVEPIVAGTQLTMVLHHNGKRDERLGVIVLVNGKSTWQQQEGEPLSLQKWLYDPGSRPDAVKGYYTDTTGKNLLPFKVLTAEESAGRASELGERVGWIDVYVFAGGPGGTGDEKKLISTRGVAVKSRGLGLKALQDKLYKANRVKRSLVMKRAEEGGLIVPGDEAEEGGAVETSSLPDAVQVGHISIKYFSPGKMEISR